MISCAASSNCGGSAGDANISDFLLFNNDSRALKFANTGSFPAHGVRGYSLEELQAFAYGDWHIGVASVLKTSGIKTGETPDPDIEGHYKK